MPNVLLVDDDAAVREVLAFQLEEAGYDVTVAVDGKQACDRIRSQTFDVVVSDVRMPNMDGLELLHWIRPQHPELPVILVSAYADVERAVEAMHAGARDYLTKPVRSQELRLRIERCLETRRLAGENERLRRDLEGGALSRLVGSSPPMAELRELIERVARSDATILIQGESGTGKELVARALHELSDRREGPFVSVNCGAIPSDLLESELFGHEPGAFTGAKHRHIGRVERADGGTLLLDEVAELPAAHQVKLLRVLQERVLDRVGGTAEIPVNIRVVAATHRDLRAEVESGRFRDDLYYRLAVIPIPVPPLRDRPGDALMLARLFARKHSKRDLVFDPSLSEAIERHTWPGNVRELENAVQRLVLVRGSDTLVADDLRLTAPISPRSVLAPGRLELPPDGFSLPELEREIIEKALDRHDGNRTHAARYLGIPRHVLLYRLSKYAK